MHRVNPPPNPFPPTRDPGESGGKKRWEFQVCPEPRADGEAKAETQRTLPPLRVRGRFPGWSKVPARPSASQAEKRPSSLGLWERPYFTKPAASLDPVTPASTPRSRLSCLEISEPPGETQSGGSPFCSRESASQRCAFPSSD